VRYPRGSGAGVPLASLEGLPFGKGRSAVSRQRMTSPRRVAILAFGTLLYPALQAAEALNATVVNMRWAKPLDVDLLLQVASQHDALVTVEEGAIMGGAGSAVTEALNAAGITLPACSSVCQMCSSSTATPRSCWPCRAWMPMAGHRQAVLPTAEG
jgi:1-deoxy-D-xylulose-5-phosphate synthase